MAACKWSKDLRREREGSERRRGTEIREHRGVVRGEGEGRRGRREQVNGEEKRKERRKGESSRHAVSIFEYHLYTPSHTGSPT